MCDPASAAFAISAAVAAGGAYMQYEGTQQAAKAQNDATIRAMQSQRQEAARQLGLSERSRAQAAQVAQESGPQQMQRRLQEAETRREQGLTTATEGDPNRDHLLGGQGDASNVVRTVISDREGEARAKLGREALARARLGSWGDAFVNLGETTAPMTDTIGMLGSFQRGSAGASGVEAGAWEKMRELGAYEGADLRAIGSGMSAIGNAGMGSAGTIGGWFAPAKAGGAALGATGNIMGPAAGAGAQTPGWY